VRADAARAALAAITSAVQAARRGELDAVVTAPICKEGFARAGFPWPGHTELLRELTGARRVGMMLLGGPLRVALATRHVPLRDVPDALTAGALREAIELADGGARWLGLRGARIAVCGLNPHAGDGGALGAEERTRIAPAIRAAVRRGVRAAGPIPGDVAFYQAARGDYAVVVAMYHDQGLAPLKLVGFETGVNLTLGLPILRTSPDHGVAYDLAGRDRADPRSTRAALDLALRLAGRANPWRQ